MRPRLIFGLVLRLRAAAVSAGGNVAILFALLLPVVVGGAGLGVETAYWRFKQLQLQAAADAAAYAGAVEKRGGSPDTRVASVASDTAALNGFSPGAIQVKGPSSGAGASNTVEVVLEMDLSRFFTAYFTTAPVHLRARSVAVYTASSDACVLALDPSASNAVLVSGSAQLTLKGCSVMANSVSDQAITVQGSGELTSPCVISGGGVSLGSGATLTSCPGPIRQAPRAADPYKDLPEPAQSTPCASTGGAVLQPGTYCNGLTLTGNVTLSPGVYVITGGDLKINANADVSGSGVTLYLDGASRLSLNGTATLNLSAPTSGVYSGVVMFGDRTSVGGRNVINGTADSKLTGAVYFPAQQVAYLGNFSGQMGCMQVVARTVEWSGHADMSVDCTSLGIKTVPALSAVRLTE